MTDTVDLTHFGHACVLVEVAPEGTRAIEPGPAERRIVRMLLDPGTYSAGFEGLSGLDAVLITHTHADHLDLERLPALLAGSPGVRLLADASSAQVLAGAGIGHQLVRAGEVLEVGGVSVEVLGGEHAVIHRDLPAMTNNAYLIGDGAVLHPGDSFTPPGSGRSVQVLLLPTGAPWLKVSEAVDYLREVAPRVAVPIHQDGLKEIHQQLHYGLFRGLGPAGTEVVVLERGVPSAV